MCGCFFPRNLSHRRRAAAHRASALTTLSSLYPTPRAHRRSFIFSSDAFAEDREDSGSKVHIRIQQRNGRKSITTLQGLEEDLDLKKILRSFKKNFKCNGAITDHKRYGEVIQLQGDQRSAARDFLVDHEIVKADQVQIHGF